MILLVQQLCYKKTTFFLSHFSKGQSGAQDSTWLQKGSRIEMNDGKE